MSTVHSTRIRPARLRAALAALALTAGVGVTAAVAPTAASAAPAAACPLVPQGVVLDRGDRGEAVKGVQCALGVGVDGIFGPGTEGALETFQRVNRLAVDGIAGPATLRALATAATIDSPAAETRAAVAAGPLLRQGSRGPAVVVLQTALGVTADGVFGPRTETAVRSVQLKAGLATDGIVGPQTRRALAAGAVAH